MVALFRKKAPRRSKESAYKNKKEQSSSDYLNKHNQGFKRFFEGALFLLFFTLVVIISFLGQKPKGAQVILNQPASSRLVAEFDFEHESKFLLKKKVAAVSARVPPVFKRTFEPFDAFRAYINRINSSIARTLIENETKSEAELFSEYEAKGEAALKIALGQKIGALTAESNFKIKPETIIEFTRLTNPKERLSLTNEALSVLEDIYKAGIHSNLNSGTDLPQIAVVQLIDESGNKNLPDALSVEDALVVLRIRLDALSGKREIARILFEIFRNGLKENLIYSKTATSEAKAKAIQKIPPQIIHFREGETLIEPGQIVTEKDIESLAAYQKEEHDRGNDSLIYNMLFLKRVIFTFLLLVAIAACLRYGLQKFYKDKRAIAIMALSVLLNLLVIRLVMSLGYSALADNSPSLALLPYISPYIFAPVITAALLGFRPAIVSVFVISVLFGILQDNSIDFLLITFLAGVVSSFIACNVTKRSMLVKAGSIAGITAGVAVFTVGLVNNLSLAVVSQQALISIIVSTLTGVVAVGILPLFEQLFKITTDITLLELTDFNHPLLRRMQVEAPGTYHHSLMVANLSENAAAEIGASPLLCRVCCLFHDIGKLVKPEYFTENQIEGINPHKAKNPSMSALVIKAHVKEGVELAHQHKLPKIIIDVIRQHHGTGLIQYFYHQAQQKQKQETDAHACNETNRSQEVSSVDESTYRYDGPRPSFKESAIIFFADSVEAASRCLKKVTQPAIEELIDTIITSRVADGQLDECPLTFKELYAIKSSFTYTLLNMLHSRVEYPKDNAKEEGSIVKAEQDIEPGQKDGQATTGNHQSV